jgi:hypothetical protein
MNIEEFNKQLESLVETIEPAILKCCEQLNKHFDQYQPGPITPYVEDDYHWDWELIGKRKLFCRLTMEDSMVHEGEPTGINWRFTMDRPSLVENEPWESLIDYALYTYTPKVWVPVVPADALYRLAELVGSVEVCFYSESF